MFFFKCLGLLFSLLLQVQAKIRLSNTLGDDMVLQRAPQSAIVWGFGTPGTEVSTTFLNNVLPNVTTGGDGIWRVELPPTPESLTPIAISFVCSDGSTAQLKDVLFGDVFLCSGLNHINNPN